MFTVRLALQFHCSGRQFHRIASTLRGWRHQRSDQTLPCFLLCVAVHSSRTLNSPAFSQTINRYGYDNFTKQQSSENPSQQADFFLSILRAVPSEQLFFYVKAFQSLLFNKVLQWRIRHFHNEVLPGDLFLQGDSLVPKGCLSEVVLPLCGHDVKLPSNEVGVYYDQILKETVGWGMEGFQKDSSPVERAFSLAQS